MNLRKLFRRGVAMGREGGEGGTGTSGNSVTVHNNSLSRRAAAGESCPRERGVLQSLVAPEKRPCRLCKTS